MAVDAEQCIYELGERPCACKVNDALIELGSAMVKQRVIELLQSGLTREQVNVILQDENLPAFNIWLRENYYCIMRMIGDDAPARTVN
jgi:hypothetical protein